MFERGATASGWPKDDTDRWKKLLTEHDELLQCMLLKTQWRNKAVVAEKMVALFAQLSDEIHDGKVRAKSGEDFEFSPELGVSNVEALLCTCAWLGVPARIGSA